MIKVQISKGEVCHQHSQGSLIRDEVGSFRDSVFWLANLLDRECLIAHLRVQDFLNASVLLHLSNLFYSFLICYVFLSKL